MTGVRLVTEFALLGAKGQSWPVQTQLDWSPDDPHAVTLLFPEDGAEWLMGRELIVAGLTSASAGDGDVQFWEPEECEECSGCVGLALDAPSGHAVFHAPRSALIDVVVRSEPGFRAAVDAWQDTWLEGVLA